MHLLQKRSWQMVLNWYDHFMIARHEMFMGIDGGGTGCRALLSDAAGRRLGTGNSGAANILNHVDEAHEHILEASRQALVEAGCREAMLADVSAFLGLAGAQVGDGALRLKSKLPFKSCIIETDAVTSLEGALGSEDGAVALIGTGSTFIYRTNGVVRTAGGWGMMVSDHASGAWLGRRLLEEVLFAYDGIRPESALTAMVLANFGNDAATVVTHADKARPAEFASLAPLIFDFFQADDPAARTIVGEAVSHIEKTLRTIGNAGTSRFCMLGGLGQIYANLLGADLQRLIEAPRDDAVGGALSLALKHFSNEVERDVRWQMI